MKNDFTQTAFSKILFNLDAGEWHGYDSESVWAELISNNQYRIENTPFFAKGVSYKDVVFVQELNGKLFFDSISILSGHSTYRILVAKEVPTSLFLDYWVPMEKSGCSYESTNCGETNLYAVDVPPRTDIHQVYDYLTVGEENGIWGFEEGHCGHSISK